MLTGGYWYDENGQKVSIELGEREASLAPHRAVKELLDYKKVMKETGKKKSQRIAMEFSEIQSENQTG